MTDPPKKIMKVSIKTSPGGYQDWRLYICDDSGKIVPVSPLHLHPITIFEEDGLIKANLTLLIDSIDIEAEAISEVTNG